MKQNRKNNVNSEVEKEIVTSEEIIKEETKATEVEEKITESTKIDTPKEEEVLITNTPEVKEEVVVKEEFKPTLYTMPPSTKTEKPHSIPIVEEDQNEAILAKLKIESYKADISEFNDRNPDRRINNSLITEKLTKKQLLGKNARYNNYDDLPYEEALRMKRDYYKLTGHEGKPLPEKTDLWMFRSPQDEINLALDQVEMLIMDGYDLKNNRTGDIITKRNLSKYISRWTKEHDNPVLTSSRN